MGHCPRGKLFAVLFCVVGERLVEYLMRIQKSYITDGGDFSVGCGRESGS